MYTYYISTVPTSDGNHTLHVYGCVYLPGFLSRRYIGDFESCEKALNCIIEEYPSVNGCISCCNSCHSNN